MITHTDLLEWSRKLPKLEELLQSENPWATVVGTWKNALASCGNINQYTDKCNVLYFGFDRYIKCFLEVQDKIENVWHVPPYSKKHYSKIYHLACIENTPSKTWLSLLQFNKTNVINTHINHYFRWINTNPQISHNLKLPDISLSEKTTNFIENNNCWLLQPFSLDNKPADCHWEYWQELLDILSDKEQKIVLVGKGYKINDEGNPNVLNLVGKTQSMLDIYAIAKKCNKIITTSNNLALWSIISNIPTIVLLDTITTEKYWLQWINNSPNTILNYDTALSEVMKII